MNAKQVLENAYNLVKKGWVKGGFHDVKRGHDCYCAVGAIRQAAFGTVALYNVPNYTINEAYSGAMEAFSKVIHPRKTIFDVQTSIVKFNDKKATKKAAVMKAFRAAIAKVA
jgi:hypothetical protein